MIGGTVKPERNLAQSANEIHFWNIRHVILVLGCQSHLHHLLLGHACDPFKRDFLTNCNPLARPEHFVFPACENGQVDPSRGIVNWRTAWRHITGSIQCPACGETQNPAKKCRNLECGAKIPDIKNPLEGLRFHDLRHSTATKLLEQGRLLQLWRNSGWSASTAVRNGQALWSYPTGSTGQALAGVATQEIQRGVHQFVHQPGRGLQSTLPN